MSPTHATSPFSVSRGHGRPLRVWFVVLVCLLQAGLITLATGLLFAEVRETARTVDQPSSSLAVVGGAVAMAYVVTAIGLLARQVWARLMAETLLLGSMLSAVAVTLTLGGDPPRPMSERWLDLAALSPMLLLDLIAFALVLRRNFWTR